MVKNGTAKHTPPAQADFGNGASPIEPWYSILMVEGTSPSQTGRQGPLETVQSPAHHGKMISPTKEGVNMEAIDATTISNMNLDECQALLASILSGNLKAKDGLLIQVEKAQGGPRGPTAKVQPRLEACQAKFLELCNRPEGVTAKELLEAGNGSYVYTDILLVARNLTEAGTIQENRKGRKATWNLTTTG